MVMGWVMNQDTSYRGPNGKLNQEMAVMATTAMIASGKTGAETPDKPERSPTQMISTVLRGDMLI
jgi:hypothetical protein